MRQFRPIIKIKHFGMVSGTGDHDLENWLGDGCMVRTSKGIRSPMGEFQITFVDKEYPRAKAIGLIRTFGPQAHVMSIPWWILQKNLIDSDYVQY